MSKTNYDPVAITQALVRCPSVTPKEGGALDYLQGILASAGFICHRLLFSQDGTPDVDNLYARLGEGRPHLCFAGHTDVVPPGDEAAWRHPPFAAEIEDGILYGRGSSDMKGNIACFIAAAQQYLEEDDRPGSMSFLITGDEEGPAVNGTIKVLNWLEARGETIDHCLVGEPSNPSQLGEAIKNGRRGSLNARLCLTGKQGHVAYQHFANNPVPAMVAVLSDLLSEPLDEGTEFFAPSNLEISTIDVGNEAENVIPAKISAAFNIRYNDTHTADGLEQMIRDTIEKRLAGTGLDFELAFKRSGDAFVTAPGPMTEILTGAIREVTGLTPELSTGGGTSDARFIKDYCPVVEFGLINATIHQVDEHVRIDDLHKLTDIYRRFIKGYFETVASS